MKIISRYVLREHVGPLTFALTALTALMLLQFISRQFGELVGKGLPWSVIGEFFLLSIPFTVALTVPMSVLVAVLYAFSRLAGENEITALNASGVSPWRLVSPAIVGGMVCSLGLLAFNDQVLPRANHRLKTLQEDISQTKPTFLLKEQVINSIAEGKYYLKAGKIDRGSDRNLLREVVIYDLADPTRRRTIYADNGAISLDSNRRDLLLDLYKGQMQEVSTDKPGQLNRLFFEHDLIRIKDVANDFSATEAGTSSKGDREMSVCEMQRRLWQAQGTYSAARTEYEDILARKLSTREQMSSLGGAQRRVPEPRGIGWAYCRVMDLLKVKEAQAATPQGSARRDSAWRQGGRAADRFVPANPPVRTPAATPAARRAAEAAAAHQAARAAAAINAGIETSPIQDEQLQKARLAEAKLRLDIATRGRNRYDIEIHKKFSLAAACLIFVLLGAPIAVRFPRGGVGLVIGVSLLVFALYYVGLIGGESLANEGLVAPFWAMWGTNVILTIVGLVLLLRMGKDSTSNRGGHWGDRIDALKAKFGRGPLAPARSAS